MSPRGDEGTEVLAVPHGGFVYIHMHDLAGFLCRFLSGKRKARGTRNADSEGSLSSSSVSSLWGTFLH